jgi:hypothetical protein
MDSIIVSVAVALMLAVEYAEGAHYHPTLSININIHDLNILAREGAGRNDPHGDGGRRAAALEKEIGAAKQALADLERTQGSRREKRRLRSLIDHLQKDAARARKGETHHN